MSEPYLGQITMFGGNFAPREYAFCDGQLLLITQYSALFSLIGTTYGGDGRTTFALPDLRSRLSIHMGQGPGLPKHLIGQSGGSQTVTITTQTLPQHTHTLRASRTEASSPTVGATYLPGTPTSGNPPYFYVAPMQGETPPTPSDMSETACGRTGGSQPHSNLMPSQCITFIIALTGIFPSRN